ncbi:hypothetical protein DEO72_LG8g1959 [Vigna unguiculata]|uniref:Uncharacterized protein n=1 Tax=Vigna unguiculata TaxID=3917 RepID=A0A4D6MVK4_VIGUN|nr:hypothetical protein DEO72_LG8g1959 [Vigna unguiculata]
MENPGMFAQTSQSRPSESTRGCALELARAVAQATSSYFEREFISRRRRGLA